MVIIFVIITLKSALLMSFIIDCVDIIIKQKLSLIALVFGLFDQNNMP